MGQDNNVDRIDQLKEKLFYKTRSIWEIVDDNRIDKISRFANDYMNFLNVAKTEREVVRFIEASFKERGYKKIDEVDDINEGDVVYSVNNGKSIIAAKIGDISNGFNMVVSHGDAPHLDLKLNPLYEEGGFAMFKTHYYGGIKKYQWLNVPLALHGVVVLADGSKQNITIGEEDKDPVFVISDLLPHLSKKLQGDKKLFDAIEGEGLVIKVGSMPFGEGDDKLKDRIKLNIINMLYEKYGLTERDFFSGEFQAVPQMKAREMGFDRSMISAYGQDDRACVYPSFRAFVENNSNDIMQILYVVDKEEIGSYGISSISTTFLERFITNIAKKLNTNINIYDIFAKSKSISGDVGGAYDPLYKSVFDESNNGKLSYGVFVERYTGHGGKYGASEATAEYTAYIRRLFDKNDIMWQASSLGKVDEGGGGTVALFVARRGINVIDCGPGIIGMHSPYEVSSKADIYETYRAYKIFFEDTTPIS